MFSHYLRQLFFADVEVRVDILDVIVVLEGVHHLQHGLGRLAFELGLGRGDHGHFRGNPNGRILPRITIDDKTIEVAEGTTVLTAARQLGISIPTLCSLEGYEPSTSCQVCLVRDRQRGQLLPSCATKAADGMQIDSDTEEVHAVRRTALELLFSDHVGDCLAPCFFACPAHMDIPLMLEQIGEHDASRAIPAAC